MVASKVVKKAVKMDHLKAEKSVARLGKRKAVKRVESSVDDWVAAKDEPMAEK